MGARLGRKGPHLDSLCGIRLAADPGHVDEVELLLDAALAQDVDLLARLLELDLCASAEWEIVSGVWLQKREWRWIAFVTSGSVRGRGWMVRQRKKALA